LEGIELYTREPSDRYPRYGMRYHLVSIRVIRNLNGSATVRVKYTVPPSEEVQQQVYEIEAGAFRTMREVLTLAREG
jgi:hypothetical protein